MLLKEDVVSGLAIRTKGDDDNDEGKDKAWPEAAAGPIMTTKDDDDKEGGGLTNPRLTRRDNILSWRLKEDK